MPQPDYENDLVFPPKSADDLNEQRRQSDVLVTTIEKCEKLEQEVKQLKDIISKMCMELVDPDDCISNGLAEYFNQDLLLEIHEVFK